MLSDLSVTPAASIRETLRTIDAAGAEIALVTDDDGTLLGTVTDGDVRRALLRGNALDDPIGPVYARRFVAVGPAAERAEVLDLMQARGISQVPIIDPAGRLLGIHLLRRLLGAEELPNVAVVMAGGRGTRLRPYTLTIPKPMLEVAGRPILERIVLHLVGAGVRRMFLAVNYRAELIEEHFGDGDRFGCEIDYLREDPDLPLGTAGALRLLPERERHDTLPILVMNGDLLTTFSVAGLLATHASAGNAITVGVSEYTHQVPYGVVDVDGDAVRVLREKPTSRWLVNAGVYALDPSIIDHVEPETECPITDVVSGCLARGERVGVHGLDGGWDDVGRPLDLHRVRGLAE